jgi:hypothetical protein
LAKRLQKDRDFCFSLASLGEVSIKSSLGKPGFQIDVRNFYIELLKLGLTELPIGFKHIQAAGKLPWVHRDPFDRLLLGGMPPAAHALAENLVKHAASKGAFFPPSLPKTLTVAFAKLGALAQCRGFLCANGRLAKIGMRQFLIDSFGARLRVQHF